jgi:hypothetical protein
MDLLRLRQQFRTVSGRFDLVNADGSDNGADFFINAGQRHLDRMDETQKSWAIAYKFCEADSYSVVFRWCRAVQEVWASTTTARWQLEKKDLQDLVAAYFTALPSGIDSGDALYYSPMITRAAPETFKTPADEFESFAGYVDVVSKDHFAYNAVLIAPPTDERILLEIKGLFYSDQLTEDTDKSYWSEMHPDVLIMSAMRSIEIINRNTQGVNDWDASIATAVAGIGKDLVEEEIAEVTQIED